MSPILTCSGHAILSALLSPSSARRDTGSQILCSMAVVEEGSCAAGHASWSAPAPLWRIDVTRDELIVSHGELLDVRDVLNTAIDGKDQ